MTLDAAGAKRYLYPKLKFIYIFNLSHRGFFRFSDPRSPVYIPGPNYFPFRLQGRVPYFITVSVYDRLCK